MSLERQVRIAAGLIVCLGVLLSWLVHPAFVALSALVGLGWFSRHHDTCGMGLLLARMPWNLGRQTTKYAMNAVDARYSKAAKSVECLGSRRCRLPQAVGQIAESLRRLLLIKRNHGGISHRFFWSGRTTTSTPASVPASGRDLGRCNTIRVGRTPTGWIQRGLSRRTPCRGS